MENAIKIVVLGILMAISGSACDNGLPPVDKCSSTDPQLVELASNAKAWGPQTWCPVNMDIDVVEVDSAGNALCAYESTTCGVRYQVGNCTLSVGIRCVFWMKPAQEIDYLSDMVEVRNAK